MSDQSQQPKQEPDTCPECGGTLESGFVLGAKHQLRWASGSDQDLKKLAMALRPGERIGKKPGFLWGRPSLRGVRCCDCRLILLRY